MAFNYVLLAGARREYADIIHYLCKIMGSPLAATGFADEFDAQIELVCENPYIHALSRMPELAACGYCSFFVKRHIVLYRVAKDLVVVAHIFHQTQDYARLV